MTKKGKIVILLLGILFFLAMEMPLIVDVRPVMVDEAWYGNTGYNLAHGFGFTNTIVGNGGNANFIAPSIIGGMMLIFGDNLLSIRLAAVLCGVLSLLVIHLIMNYHNCSIRCRTIGYGLFISVTVLNSVFRYGRPEFAALLFMASGVLGYFRYYDSHSWADMAIISISALLATCSHPYSLLLFALMGIVFLIDAIEEKRPLQSYLQLLLLLTSAVVALSLISFVGVKYNLVTSSEPFRILNRLGGDDIWSSVNIYLNKVFLSKHFYVTIPGVLIAIYAVFKAKQRSVKILALLTLAFMTIFPFLFAADVNMLGNAVEYFVLLSVLIFISLYKEFENMVINKILSKMTYYLLSVVCVIFCLITLYFNFKVKYENSNSVLSTEIDQIIPDGSLVFGPIRQWPCKMNCRYYSDHSRYQSLPKSFDYIITNDEDLARYDIYEEVMNGMDNYELVYHRVTRQYGNVEVYKYRKITEIL